MKIFRNGEAFELTFTEIIQAHEEYEFSCAMEEVRSLIGPETPRLSDEQVKQIAMDAIRSLAKNDSYYESYWITVKNALNQYVKDMEANEWYS